MPVKLTICLVAYNGAKYLPACLDSVFEQNFQNWQMLILDNGSTDDSVEIIKRLAQDNSKITILPPEEKNTGFTGGYNKLMQKAESEYILLLNQDIILMSNYIEKIVKFMDEHQAAGAAIGKILRLTNGKKIANIDTAGLRVFPSFKIADMGAGEKDQRQYDSAEEIFGACGCLPMYRKKAMEQVGYFDKKFFLCKEDIDLAFRLQYAGWKSYRAGSAVAYHERGVSGFEQLNETNASAARKNKSSLVNYLSYRNHLYLLIKNLALSDLLRCGIFIFYYEFKKLIYLILFEQKSLYAWIEVMKNLPELIMQRKLIKPRSVKKWIA